MALDQIARNRAAFLVVPCCIGKLKLVDSRLEEKWQRIGRTPRSEWLAQVAGEEDYLEMAKAADHAGKGTTPVVAKTKLLLERDRAQWLREKHGYSNIFITQIEPPEATPKRDILFGRP